jgi:hypothetical protein
MSHEIEKANDEISSIITIVEDCNSELDILSEEMLTIDGLYEDLKTHFDVVKKDSRKSSGGLRFISEQTSNLISIKNLKVSMLKARIDIKNKRFTQVIKVKTTLESKDKGTSGVFNAADIAKELLKLDPNIKTMYTRTEIDADYISSYDIDAELNKILELNNLNTIPSDTKIDEVSASTVDANIDDANELDLVSDEYGCIHVVDKDLNAYNPADYGIDTNGKVEISSILNDKKEDIGLQATFMGEIIRVIPANKLKRF